MLPELGSKERKDAKERIAELSDSMIGSPGGFAFLIWNTLGETWVDLQNYNGPVTSAMIPDFSKSHLHAEMTMRWTVERLKGHS